jgi:glycosyltransferase involved in cell wall biosynthesis
MSQMRIGIDATALPPKPVGAGNYIIELVRAIHTLDSPHEFIIFAQQHGRDLIGSPGRDGFEWISLPNHSPARRLIWEQVGFPELLKKQRIDLLHSLHYTRPFRLSCQSIVTIHDMTFFLFPQLHTKSKRIFFPLMIRYSASAADALIADSESTRQDAIRILGLQPEKISTVPLGVRPDFRPVHDQALKAAVRARYHLPDKFLLFVGLVEPRKNLSLLLKSYRQVANQGSHIPLVIVGRKGWMYEQVLDLIASLGLADKVHLAGYVSPEDLPIVYNLADVFIYPSLYEGFGLPPLEALACGTPVITTAVSSMPEHVGQAGLLIPPGDENALTQAIISLLNDQELKSRLAVLGPPQAAQFTWTRTAHQTLQVYENVLKTG